MQRHHVVRAGLSACAFLAHVACAGSTITVDTAANTIDFAATGSTAGTLVRPVWDMIPQVDNDNQSSPSSGVWVPASDVPTVAQLVADLASRGDGKVSLREAIVVANATQYAGSETGPTTIVFDTVAMGGTTIMLDAADNWWYGPNALPPIHAEIIIDGGDGITLRRENDSSNAASPFRLIYVAGRFHNLVDGKASTIPTPGHLTLRHISLRHGLAFGGDSGSGGGGGGFGGAIYNQGTLVLDGSILSTNHALGGRSGISGLGPGGGGIGQTAPSYTASGSGFRYRGPAGSGGGFLSANPRVEGGEYGVGSQGGTSRFGGEGAPPTLPASPCTTFANGGGFRSDGTPTSRGDGGGYSSLCLAGAGAFGGGGANTGGAGGVGGGGGARADGGFGGGGGLSGLGGFGGGSGRGRSAWGFGGGGGDPDGALDPGGGGAGLGGAIFNHTGSVRVLSGTQITDNTAEGGAGFAGGSGFGGGIFNLNGDVRIDASNVDSNQVLAGANIGGGAASATAGGALYSRFQDEDAGIRDLGAITPSTSLVTLSNGASLSGSIGGSDCHADAAQRQGSGNDEARLPYFNFDGIYEIGVDATGIQACASQDRPGMHFVYTYLDNPAGDFASRGWLDANSLFQRNIRAAAAIWADEFAPSTRLRIAIRIDANHSEPMFSAGTYYGRAIGTFTGPNGANTIREPSALQKWNTGSSTAGVHDMRLLPNSAFVDQWYWLDPTPENRDDNAIPAGRNDLVSIALHEFEHGFGFASWRQRENTPEYGHYTGEVTRFDNLSVLLNSDPASQSLFIGPYATAAFGGQPVPLTRWGPGTPNSGSDFSHFATTCTHRDNDTTVDPRLRYALMTTCPLPVSGYVSITPIDRAVMLDLGYPIDRIMKGGFER